MYKLNPLMRNVLITADEVIFHAPTKHTLDPRTIHQSIIIAEERFIRTALDFPFYTSLAAQKNKVVTDINKAELQALIGATPVLKNGDIVNAMEFLSTDNLALWKEYLWKLAAECVMVTAFPESFIQFGSEGVMHTMAPAGPMNSAGAVTPDLRSMKWAMDKKLMDRISPLLESLHNHLCLNKSKFSLYTKYCECDDRGESYKGKRTNVILGIYDDDPDKCCNGLYSD